MAHLSRAQLNKSKKHKFVGEGVLRAELNDFLMGELAEDGYSGLEIRIAPSRTEIIIMATRTQSVLGERGRRIRELTAVISKRFGMAPGSIELYAEAVAVRGLCAIAQAESLRYKLVGGLAVRRACYGVLRFIMESGAKGCEVVVSGKLRGQRAKAMKFVDGLMIHSGDVKNTYVEMATRHVLLRQGVLGIRIKIMLPWDPTGKRGPKKPLPDFVEVTEPKEHGVPPPKAQRKASAPAQIAPPAPPIVLQEDVDALHQFYQEVRDRGLRQQRDQGQEQGDGQGQGEQPALGQCQEEEQDQKE